MGTGSVAVLTSALLLATASAAVAQKDPPIPPPPAPAALAVPNPLAAMTPGPRDLYRSPDGSDRFQHLSPYPAPPPVFFFPGPYVPGPYYPYAVGGHYSHSPRPIAPAVAPRGVLMLESLPDTAQVYVDGFYVGIAEEFGPRTRPLLLPAGPHRVEVRAPGYEVLAFNVLVEPNDMVRFRGQMQALPAATPLRAASPAAPAKSFYVIPNCYAGDKPPTGGLPRGCDVRKMQTRK
jgi:hypothetical protein